MVLSFSFRSKRLDAKSPLTDARSRLEELDIKTVEPYVVGKTSYVVQNKRNTAKGLQALVNGKWIVEKSYIDAIVYAATPSDLENEEALCPLEEDFDNAWPDAQQHLPPRGKEPTDLPDSAYGPDPDRLNVFEGYVFVFCEKNRFDELQGPITNGHGKALLYELDAGKTTADDIVDYLRKAGGNKGLALEHEGSGGVLLVEFPGSNGHEAWAQDVQQRIGQLTGQKVLSTGEFLNAILQNNTLQLCQPASRDAPGSQHQNMENNDTQAMDVDQDSAPASNVETSAAGESQAPRPAKRPRRPYVPKFKAFDDGFDMDSIPEYNLEKDGEPTQEDTQVSASACFVSPLLTNKAMESIPEESQAQEAVEDEMVADLLPGATAMRQRIGGMKRRNPTPPPEAAKKAKRPKLDVKEAARQRREAEDEAVMADKKDMASFQAVVDGMTVAEMQNLAITEEMTVRPRKAQSQDEVDERWNGRKNFKKFRRKGNPGGAVQHRIQTVIVPLEEVARKDNGLGDGYAGAEKRRVKQPVIETPAIISQAASRAESRSRAGSQAVTQSQVSVSASTAEPTKGQKRPREGDGDSDDDGLRFRFRRRRQ